MIIVELLKGFQNDHQYVQNDVDHQNIVEYEARGIPLFAYLDYVEYLFLHGSIRLSDDVLVIITYMFCFIQAIQYMCFQERDSSAFSNRKKAPQDHSLSRLISVCLPSVDSYSLNPICINRKKVAKHFVARMTLCFSCFVRACLAEIPCSWLMITIA